jgi:hypothetical protein
MAEKIPDDALREFALSDSRDTREVIVELDLPEPRVEVAGVRIGDTTTPISRRAIEPSPENEQLIEKVMGDAAGSVEEIVGQPPTRLRYAHALVTVVTPRQLREIAAIKLTRVIRPNRELD